MATTGTTSNNLIFWGSPLPQTPITKPLVNFHTGFTAALPRKCCPAIINIILRIAACAIAPFAYLALGILVAIGKLQKKKVAVIAQKPNQSKPSILPPGASLPLEWQKGAFAQVKKALDAFEKTHRLNPVWQTSVAIIFNKIFTKNPNTSQEHTNFCGDAGFKQPFFFTKESFLSKFEKVLLKIQEEYKLTKSDPNPIQSRLDEYQVLVLDKEGFTRFDGTGFMIAGPFQKKLELDKEIEECCYKIYENAFLGRKLLVSNGFFTESVIAQTKNLELFRRRSFPLHLERFSEKYNDFFSTLHIPNLNKKGIIFFITVDSINQNKQPRSVVRSLAFFERTLGDCEPVVYDNLIFLLDNTRTTYNYSGYDWDFITAISFRALELEKTKDSHNYTEHYNVDGHIGQISFDEKSDSVAGLRGTCREFMLTKHEKLFENPIDMTTILSKFEKLPQK